VALYLAWFYRQRAKNCRLLILSRRDPIPDGFGIQRHAEDMIRTVEELHFGPSVWECISAAGPIGQWAAVQRPDLVSGLILSSTYDWAEERIRRVFQKWLNVAEQAGGDLLWGLIEQKYRPPVDVLATVDPALLPDLSVPRDVRRLKQILLELIDLDQRWLVPRIGCPTLVIGGQEDRVVPADVQRAMAARIPGSCLELCAGYGHFNDMENPAYQGLVDRHLQAVFGPHPARKDPRQPDEL
jgi:pimeloyl-ACP methyl ester carboxylesterase